MTDNQAWKAEKRPINLVTCRASERERDRLKSLVKKYGLAGPSHFFRTCLEKFFEADDDGNLKLPIDLARTKKEKPAQKPRNDGSRRKRIKSSSSSSTAYNHPFWKK
jgi:hypothetical protein